MPVDLKFDASYPICSSWQSRSAKPRQGLKRKAAAAARCSSNEMR
jgi:hypothetical protein